MLSGARRGQHEDRAPEHGDANPARRGHGRGHNRSNMRPPGATLSGTFAPPPADAATRYGTSQPPPGCTSHVSGPCAIRLTGPMTATVPGGRLRVDV